LIIEPTNKIIINELSKIRHDVRLQRKKEKQIFKGLFLREVAPYSENKFCLNDTFDENVRKRVDKKQMIQLDNFHIPSSTMMKKAKQFGINLKDPLVLRLLYILEKQNKFKTIIRFRLRTIASVICLLSFVIFWNVYKVISL